MDRPNILLIMTDEERYPPPYETAEVRAFRADQLPARQGLRARGVEFHRHYAGSTACTPSRATLFTGQYPSLHGVSATDGTAKRPTDPALGWLDPDSVPTLGDWFRAGGYRTHYRGKWHVSHANLQTPGTHDGLMASDDEGRPLPDAVDAYRRADRLDPFGFSGWIGREPHGAAKSDCGTVRDGVFAEQVVELFDELVDARADGPWLTVASFVNPHDITFSGFGWEQLLQFGPPDDVRARHPRGTVAVRLLRRPATPARLPSRQPGTRWSTATATDLGYRRLYYYLHQLVDAAIARILDRSRAERHGRRNRRRPHVRPRRSGGRPWWPGPEVVQRLRRGRPGPVAWRQDRASRRAVRACPSPPATSTSIPTLLGLAGIDPEQAAAGVSSHHDEVHPLPGRDLSGLVRGEVDAAAFDSPIYFMTEDNVTSGADQVNILNGTPFDAITGATSIESVVASLPTGDAGGHELWKVNHYYERLDDWYAEHGVAPNPFLAPAAEPLHELHNLTRDPEERQNLAGSDPSTLSRMLSVLEDQRGRKRLLPTLRNPA